MNDTQAALPELPAPSGYASANGFKAMRQDESTALLYRHEYLIRPNAVQLYTADQMRDYARDALAATPAPTGEPVAWGQLGTLNGKTYLRMNYDRIPYPPAADIVRNLNLVPLYAAPPAPAASPSEDALDAARYRWLTADHPKHETRARVYEIASSMNVRGKGHIDAAIDAAMAAQEHKHG